jgi:hypothetical protein
MAPVLGRTLINALMCSTPPNGTLALMKAGYFYSQGIPCVVARHAMRTSDLRRADRSSRISLEQSCELSAEPYRTLDRIGDITYSGSNPLYDP